MSVEVGFTTDAGEAWECTGGFLRQDPVRCNVIATLLVARAAADEPIRYWWAHRCGEVLGAVFQSPTTFPAALTPMAHDAVEPLARAVAGVDDPPVRGAAGSAATAAAFAGAFATATRCPAHPAEGQRIYEVAELRPAREVPGVVRIATGDDVGLVRAWVLAFDRDTGIATRHADPTRRAQELVGAGRLRLWERDGVPRCSTLTAPSVAGVSRVGFVYTPPEGRGSGYASALVGAVSTEVLDAGDRCILYTQLANPVSNAIYQRLGYQPVDEVIRYEFDATHD